MSVCAQNVNKKTSSSSLCMSDPTSQVPVMWRLEQVLKHELAPKFIHWNAVTRPHRWLQQGLDKSPKWNDRLSDFYCDMRIRISQLIDARLSDFFAEMSERQKGELERLFQVPAVDQKHDDADERQSKKPRLRTEEAKQQCHKCWMVKTVCPSCCMAMCWPCDTDGPCDNCHKSVCRSCLRKCDDCEAEIPLRICQACNLFQGNVHRVDCGIARHRTWSRCRKHREQLAPYACSECQKKPSINQ